MELLVVLLIIGILAAIAIPSFIAQRSKAQDASTKSMARTAATAIETYATDHNSDYTGADGTALHGIEPAIPDSSAQNNWVEVGSADTGSYTVTAHNTHDGHAFSVERKADGTSVRTCAVAAGEPTGNAGGCVNSSW